MTSTPKPLVLIILDGFGHSEIPEHNAIFAAKTPVYDRLRATCARLGISWLERETWVHIGVRFVGATLWSDLAVIGRTLALIGLQGASVGNAVVSGPQEATEAAGDAACLAALHLIAISRKWAGQTKGIGFRP